MKAFICLQQDYSRKFEEFRKLSYDETNRRVREVEEILLGSDKEYVDRLYLYNEVRQTLPCYYCND